MKTVQAGLVFLVCLLTFSQVSGQNKRSFKVLPGQKVIDAIPIDAIYAYQEFKPGTVQFKNGRVGKSRLNYNCLDVDMEFINEQGDTLVLENLSEINYVYFTNPEDTFYCDKGFLRLLTNRHDVKLAVRKVITLANGQNIGGFGAVNGGTGEVSGGVIYTKDQVKTNPRILKTAIAHEEMTFSENYSWYFGDRYNQYTLATKKNVLNLYGKTKPGLVKYLDDHHVNFSNEEDIVMLSTYLQE